MATEVGFESIDCNELKAWVDDGKAFVLLDVLTGDAYAETHIHGAKNACIYEVTFLDQVKEHAADTATDIVVYDSGPASRASADAAARLVGAGYTNVREFGGGRTAWHEAGHAFDGTKATWEPTPADTLEDRAYEIDTERSVVEWTGRNPGGRHCGTLKLTGGAVQVGEGGAFEIDMKTIEVTDLEGDMAELLVQHLASDDFFAVADHPTARLEITAFHEIEGATPGAPNYHIESALTLRGITEDIAFDALVAPKAGELVLDAHFDIDRTRWNISYGSGKFYDHLGMHLVNDDVSLQVRVVAK